MKNKVSKYINELLQDYDCVIIPSFGGFVANYQGAKIHPTQHIFQPPCKNIAFNKNLVSNDGLLANALVNDLSISYHEALQIIDRFVFNLNNQLTEGKKIEIPYVGFLKLDVEKNIQFSSVNTINYLHQSYGLNNFQSSAVQRSGYHVPFEIKFKDRSTVKPERKSRLKKLKYLTPLAILPFAAALFLWPLETHFKKNITTQASGYFSTKPSIESVYKNNNHLFDLQPSTAATIVFPSTSAIIIDADNNIAVPETTAVAKGQNDLTSQQVNNYSLITGCFALRENAEKQVQILASKNITAAIIGQNKSGLFRVSCGNFNDLNTATIALQQFKAELPEVWVLKH